MQQCKTLATHQNNRLLFEFWMHYFEMFTYICTIFNWSFLRHLWCNNHNYFAKRLLINLQGWRRSLIDVLVSPPHPAIETCSDYMRNKIYYTKSYFHLAWWYYVSYRWIKIFMRLNFVPCSFQLASIYQAFLCLLHDFKWFH